MQRFKAIFLCTAFVLFFGCGRNGEPDKKSGPIFGTDLEEIPNPFIPGYLGDPSIITDGGKFYVYGTLDPWGGYEPAVWESEDFSFWTLQGLNWPNYISCHTPGSNHDKISAPCVVRGEDGLFYMYVSAGGHIWAGASVHPLGPWENVLPDEQPLIAYEEGAAVLNRDPECFIDDDGQAYLYWGGTVPCSRAQCLGVLLDTNMHSFKGQPVEITPPGYTGGPSLIKHSGRYIMFYSGQHCDYARSVIRYAVSDNPLGPWAEGSGSPILLSDKERVIMAPGHPDVFTLDSISFLLYHANMPDPDYKLYRQLYMQKIIWDSAGISLAEVRTLSKSSNYPMKITGVSSQRLPKYPASALTDGHYGTLWVPSEDDRQPSFTVDLGEKRSIETVYIWFEFGNYVYKHRIDYSPDGRQWEEFADAYRNQKRGSPRFHNNYVDARYLRFSFDAVERPVGIWEIGIR